MYITFNIILIVKVYIYFVKLIFACDKIFIIKFLIQKIVFCCTYIFLDWIL